MKESKSKLSLNDLPPEMIVLINQFLEPKDTARWSQVNRRFFQDLSKAAKKAAVTEALENIVVKVLDSLNPHDLFFLADQDENIAMVVVQTPELATKLNQSLYGDYHQPHQEGYKKEQYETQNCLDATGKRYTHDIPDPLALIAKSHPKVAELLLSDDYDVIDLRDRTNAALKSMVPPNPGP
ncbi:hypothetical protein ACQUW5_06505 [Legionella sp. CNM-1927-20]|uniref:hypothetical protein n=1 Tax=Legionella sp. CNM-1927-20 TaxID=3422221 RepID=UPI00403B0C1C